MSHHWVRAALTIGFAALLILGAIAKLLDSRGFSQLLLGWHVLPAAILPAIAVLLVLVEFQAGIGLLAGGRRRRWGAAATIGAYLFYVIAQAQALMRGYHAPLEGAAAWVVPMALTWGALARDAVVLLLAVGLRRLLERRSPERGQTVPVRWAARR